MRELGLKMMRVERSHNENTWHAMSVIEVAGGNQEALGAAETCAAP